MANVITSWRYSTVLLLWFVFQFQFVKNDWENIDGISLVMWITWTFSSSKCVTSMHRCVPITLLPLKDFICCALCVLFQKPQGIPYILREHPLNLKGGGGGAMVLLGEQFLAANLMERKFCLWYGQRQLRCAADRKKYFDSEKNPLS